MNELITWEGRYLILPFAFPLFIQLFTQIVSGHQECCKTGHYFSDLCNHTSAPDLNFVFISRIIPVKYV